VLLYLHIIVWQYHHTCLFLLTAISTRCSLLYSFNRRLLCWWRRKCCRQESTWLKDRNFSASKQRRLSVVASCAKAAAVHPDGVLSSDTATGVLCSNHACTCTRSFLPSRPNCTSIGAAIHSYLHKCHIAHMRSCMQPAYYYYCCYCYCYYYCHYE
jgi:hypothetical protein